MSNESGNSEIYLLQLTDSSRINLTNHEAGDNWARWSPDREKIVFQSNRSGNLDIWIMNSDGSDPVQLTDHPDHDYLPSFTPDGNSISFTTWRTEDPNEVRSPHIYLMNTDGSDQRRLVREPLNTSAGAAWHPDGSKFLFTQKKREQGADIFEADNNGNLLRQLTDDTLYSAGAEYSPDGNTIVYTQDYGDSTRVLLLDVETELVTILLSGEQIYYPHWSPDGQWIIYTKIIPDADGNDLDIFAISLDEPENQILLVNSKGRDAEGIWK